MSASARFREDTVALIVISSQTGTGHVDMWNQTEVEAAAKVIRPAVIAVSKALT